MNAETIFPRFSSLRAPVTTPRWTRSTTTSVNLSVWMPRSFLFARVEHFLRRQSHAAGRFAAADLRAEALGHDRVVALVGRRDQRLAGADDPAPAGATHPDYQVVGQ